ncbi:MAG: electron transfer flavoprotein subunit alpha/FixB family protein [Oscillospiraceae bacterium]|nr:electron transfer flavoprotein subunit alpha/FixB family protein [Oscillospiraceae bacterium]
MKQELLLIQGTLPDMGLQSKAAQLALKGHLTLRVISGANLEAATADDGAIAKALIPQAQNARVILAPATTRLRAILPMLAWYLQAGLTADCTHLDISPDGTLLQTRPAFGNSLIATIETVSGIQMATVRPGTFPVSEGAEQIPVETLQEKPAQRVKLLEFVPLADSVPLGEAKIIVAGGAGIGSSAGFLKLADFAGRIGGVVGASRNAVDAGYVPYSAQVGMTGITVCPKLYIAVGISGAVQHLAGMSGSTTVIAINSDPKAPIFQYADYGIVGDWESIIDQLMEELS